MTLEKLYDRLCIATGLTALIGLPLAMLFWLWFDVRWASRPFWTTLIIVMTLAVWAHVVEPEKSKADGTSL